MKYQDELSEKINEYRLAYFHNGDKKHLHDELYVTVESYRNKRKRPPLIDFYFREDKDVIVYGAGGWGLSAVSCLTHYGKNIVAVCDSEKRGELLGHTISVPEDVDFSNLPIIIATESGVYINEIVEKLQELGASHNQLILATAGNHPVQYFDPDIVKPLPREVYVNCGCFDGLTVRSFLNFAPNGKVYAFEPNPIHYDMCKKANFPNTQLFNKAVYSAQTDLKFDVAGSVSQLTDVGGITVEAVRIDDAISDNVTLITMDIEGSESEALKGAERLVKQYLPRLAICVYHKPEDIIEIPELIANFSDKYKFYLRHEVLKLFDETVVYAIADGGLL
jgi:FkbM family methyltransferase